MCLDTKTSIITLVIGTLLNIWNIIHYNNTTITVVSILWQWILLMQVFEAFAWQNQPTTSGECNNVNKWATKGAYLANITQPIVLAIVLFVLKGDSLSQNSKIIAGSILTGYILWLLYASNKIPEVKCLTPQNKCSNLTYYWWNQFPGNAIVYLIALIGLIGVMIKPLNFALLLLTYIVLTLVISSIFYSCGSPGSMWCLLVSFGPLLVGPMWEATK